jgi:hypothetical protein
VISQDIEDTVVLYGVAVFAEYDAVHAGKRAGPLLELMYQTEHFTLARAWQNLTDDGFLREPFTTAWSIRR